MLHYFITTAGIFIVFHTLGMGTLTLVELAFSRHEIDIRDRIRGLKFIAATVPVYAGLTVLFGALVGWLDPKPIISFKSGFGSPLIAAIVLALWLDFQFYWLHRFEHRFLWRFHRVHHSIRHVTAINCYHHWTEHLWVALAGVPLLFVQFDIAPTLGLLSVILRHQAFFIHSPSRVQFGPLRRVLIDHPYHRIHHSMDPAHYGKNFGAFSPVWDWLFGTLYLPKKGEWPALGLADVAEPQTLWDWSAIPFKGRGPAKRRKTSDSSQFLAPSARD